MKHAKAIDNCDGDGGDDNNGGLSRSTFSHDFLNH